LESLERGVYIDGKKQYQGMKAEIQKTSGTNTWLSIILKEGKNRQIR
jgi:16S rRNA U516 pseudouridylate synthase RsuA-like enzyme